MKEVPAALTPERMVLRVSKMTIANNPWDITAIREKAIQTCPSIRCIVQ